MEKIIWTREMEREIAKIEARHGFDVIGIVALRFDRMTATHSTGVAWREKWEDHEGNLVQALCSRVSPFQIFKIFLRSLGRRPKSSQ